MTDAAATTVKEQFNDLSAEFRNSRGEIKALAAGMMTGSGEFSGSMSDGSASFDISWQDAFEVCATSSALISGNTNSFKVDLDSLDTDSSLLIVL